ncbi:MAG: hypothetical protein PWP17_989, partial [Desulfomicrobiaceae bacterium]|nr:hypothetical protein [Desulfomicrobiaceae bacterium]
HPVMTLSETRRLQMEERFAHTTDPAAWLAAITEEPLWQPGYERLAHWLEARGAWQEALPLRFLAAQFFPGAKQFLALAKTATRAGIRPSPATPADFWKKNAKRTSTLPS